MSSYGDYEFELRTPSGKMTGTLRKKPDSLPFYILMTVLLGLLCVGCFSWLNTGSIFGTDEPEKRKEVYENYRGVWEAKGELPGKKEETTVRVSVPTDTAKESRVKFSNPQCSARVEADGILENFTTFTIQGNPKGTPKWCGEIYEATLRGDYGGDHYEKKLSDKVTLTVTTGEFSDEQVDIVDEWPAKRLQKTFNPSPSPSPKTFSKLPKAFEGTWTGGPVKPSAGDTKRPEYSVVLKLTEGRVGDKVGTVTYPELGCSGSVSLEDNRTNTSTQVNLEEQLESDPKAMCTNIELKIPQHIELDMNDDETLAFEAVTVNDGPDEKPGGTATLTRK